MDEKEFLEFLVNERMGMHYEKFKSDYPPTEEQAAEEERAKQVHEQLIQQLSKEQRDLLELWQSLVNSEIVRENEYYYRAGFKDGMSLDRLIKKIKEEKL